MKDSKKQAMIFKALGDPTRLAIIDMLRSGEMCVCKIIPATGKSQPNVSAHLKVLYNAGLVEYRREGISVYYRLSGRWVASMLSSAEKSISKTK